jgi:cytochrome c-type biogenesis protein CcmH/NrfF
VVKWTATAALWLVLGAAAPALADGESATSGWAYDAANELMSPFCPGRTLSDCPSPAAESMRLWLHVQEAAGRTREDVETELFARYGDIMRAAPRAEGVGLSAYVVPLVAFAAGGVLVAFVLRRLTRGGAEPAAPPQSPAARDPELERLVDEELTR